MKRHATLLKAVAVWVFLSVWISAMASGLAGAKCAKFHLPAETRLASCQWGQRLGLPVALILPRAEQATGWVAQGAALADLGRADEAKALFARALEAVRLTPPVDVIRDPVTAHARARRVIGLGAAIPEGTPARTAFLEVLAGRP